MLRAKGIKRAGFVGLLSKSCQHLVLNSGEHERFGIGTFQTKWEPTINYLLAYISDSHSEALPRRRKSNFVYLTAILVLQIIWFQSYRWIFSILLGP